MVLYLSAHFECLIQGCSLTVELRSPTPSARVRFLSPLPIINLEARIAPKHCESSVFLSTKRQVALIKIEHYFTSHV